MNIFEHITKLEKSLLSHEVRSCEKQLDLLLSDDFLEFGKFGAKYTKQEIVKALKEETSGKIRLFETKDFEYKQLAEGSILITYISIEDDQREIQRTSIWCRVNDQWKMEFHQGTPINK